MAATEGSSASATRRAASAVESTARSTTPGSSACRKARHWAVATGIDTTVRMSSSEAPGTASRCMDTGITTSRWMRRSTSNASVSTVTLTEPLERVLDGHEADVDRAVGGGTQHVGHAAERHPLAPRQVGLGEQCLLTEGGLGTEEAHAETGAVCGKGCGGSSHGGSG